MPETALSHVLIATAPAAASERALLRGAALAAQHGAQLTLLHVVRSSDSVPHRRAQARLTERANQLAGEFKVKLHISQSAGASAEEIAAAIRESGADLAVFGAHEPDLFGGLASSASEKVLRQADCRLLVVRRSAPGPWREVLVATEATPASYMAARAARALAPGADFVAIHVVDSPFRSLTGETVALEAAVRDEGLAALAGWLEALGGDAMKPLVLVGDPAARIVECAAERGSDLIALCSRASPEIVRFLVGGVAERVLRDAPCDVLLVPPS